MQITIISLDLYGYDFYIVEELEERGYVVNHFNIDKNKYQYKNVFEKIFNGFRKVFLGKNYKKDHLNKTILENIEKLGHQDKILMIRPDKFYNSTLRKISCLCDEFLAFHYDGSKKAKGIIKTFPLFDRNFTFDKEDAKKYNLIFITNFIYKECKLKKNHTAFHVSTLDSRVKLLEKIVCVLNSKKVNCDVNIVSLDENYNPPTGLPINFLNKRISIEELDERIKKSSIHIDNQRNIQTGLTFRVFESMGYRAKLITSNVDIMNYDFYNTNNILVIDEDNVVILDSFLASDYEEIPEHIYQKYTLKSWVDTVFNLPTTEYYL